MDDECELGAPATNYFEVLRPLEISFEPNCSRSCPQDDVSRARPNSLKLLILQSFQSCSPSNRGSLISVTWISVILVA